MVSVLHESRRNKRVYIWWLILSIAYVISAEVGFTFASISNNVTLIWPPSGIALAALLIMGARVSPGIFIGALIANYLSGMPLTGSMAIALGNTMEAIIALFILQKLNLHKYNSISSVRGILWLYSVAVIAPVVASANGAYFLNNFTTDNNNFNEIFLTWWLGDVLGIMVLTPLILSISSRPYRFGHKQLKKSIIVIISIIVATLISFTDWPASEYYFFQLFETNSDINIHKPSHQFGQYPIDFVPLAVLVWVGFKHKIFYVGIAIIVLTMISIMATSFGYGPFYSSDKYTSLTLLTSYIMVCVIVGYTLSVSTYEKAIIENELLASKERYELVMRGTEDGVWDWDISSNKYFVSRNLKKMLNYETDDIPDWFEFWQKLIHPEDKNKTMEALYNHAQGKTDLYESEYRLLKKNGDYIWVLGRAKALIDEHNKAFRMVGSQINLTKRNQTAVRLELADNVIKNSREGIIVTDADLNILSVNSSFIRISGYGQEDVIGRKPDILSSGRHDSSFYQAMWKDIIKHGYWKGEIWNRRRDGEIYPEWLSISTIQNNNGEILNYVGMYSNIGHKEQIDKELHNLAYYDALTGLPNRELFTDRLMQIVTQENDGAHTVGLLFIDLDRFKNINDTLGHKVGDSLLVEAASRIHRCLPKNATVARMGGDEFSIILPDISQSVDAAHIAELILNEFSMHTFSLNKLELYISASIGISLYPVDGNTSDVLIKNADTAMYRAKESGRNTFQFFESNMSERFHERLELEADLRKAISKNELFINYQPQIDLSNKKLIGVEALLRWRHEHKGLISPAIFIPIAEESGLIGEIGEWVLRHALFDAKTWVSRGHENITVAVNISSIQLKQFDFLDIVHDAINNAGVTFANLELEITESVLMDDIDIITELLAKLSNLGIQLSVDDFGTGYSSLSYLKRFSIDKLKIDQSFVREITTNTDDAEIAATIIAMGHNLQLRVIAEGVETQEQLDFLIAKACDEIQGYFISKPVPAEEILRMLEQGDSITRRQIL